ncbi:MAG: hypothetical protein QNJ06_03970 [Kiloniellales bacterium]|nr:hypothetical protein [Kiloniellales bacterium]MDJ0969036.1 hypothetical protein [Kiloniellales bacterium]MDJ0982190.1 hypothetical protein [Kiloniellales bacterium]
MTHPFRGLVLAGCFLGLLTGATQAAEQHVEPMKNFANATVKQWISEPVMISAIKAQNDRYANLTQSQIDGMDIQWRTETVLSRKPLINQVSGNPLSKRLMELKAATNGVVTEIFVMDNRGMNVAISDVTSDYWQGDEDKWQKTFLVGPGTVFVDAVEHDASTDSFQSQLSMSISDPATGQVIGAITLGINVDRLNAVGL